MSASHPCDARTRIHPLFTADSKKSWSFCSKTARRLLLSSEATRHCAAMQDFYGLGKQTRQKLRDQLVANVRGEE
jgi:hypothetical protein